MLMDAESSLHEKLTAEYDRIKGLDAENARLKAEMTEFVCFMSDESQIVSGCRDDYERGRYEAFRQAIDFHERRKAAK